MERQEQRVRGPTSKVSPAMEALLDAQLQAASDRTLAELQEAVWSELKVSISLAQLWRTLRRMGLRRKKSIHASEQDSEEGRRRRQTWREQIASIDARRLVFIDESGATTEMTRRYGRAPGGQRVREATPAGHWRTLTVLGAMSADGLIAAMTIEAPTDRDVFLGYLEQVLCPRLKPGQIVVIFVALIQIDMQQHAVVGGSLAAVAGDGIAVVDLAGSWRENLYVLA